MTKHTPALTGSPVNDQTVKLVQIDDLAWIESSDPVSDILTGQIEDARRVVEFNTADGTARDVSLDVADEVIGMAKPDDEEIGFGSATDFLEMHLGCDRVARELSEALYG